VVQRAISLARVPLALVYSSDLLKEIRRGHGDNQGTLVEKLDAIEREMILSALEKKHWVQTQAVELLGVSERVLRHKMKKHNIVYENL
jgi:two-component system, NtrC family, response regulator AtoC